MNNAAQQTTEIAELPSRQMALQVFTAEQGLDPYLAQIRQEIDGFQGDTSTAKGRAQIASMAHKVARSKTALDSIGKELVAELKEKPRLIDAERKRMRDILDQWKTEVRAPLTEWEQAEEGRIKRHQYRLDELKRLAEPDADANLSSKALTKRLEQAKAVQLGDAWEEFQAEAGQAKDAVITILEARIIKAIEAEREAEEERARRKAAREAEQAEREKRIAEEAAERARAEAEQEATRERERLEQQHQAEREEAARAERERLQAIEAERQRRIEAENERLRKQQAEAEEAERRAANLEHRRAVNRAAKEALIAAGLTEKSAEKAVRAIAAGDVPAVSITY